jgi:hypothetical protein
MITDEIVDTFVVSGTPEQIAPRLHDRYGDLVQRVSFDTPDQARRRARRPRARGTTPTIPVSDPLSTVPDALGAVAGAGFDIGAPHGPRFGESTESLLSGRLGPSVTTGIPRISLKSAACMTAGSNPAAVSTRGAECPPPNRGHTNAATSATTTSSATPMSPGPFGMPAIVAGAAGVACGGRSPSVGRHCVAYAGGGSTGAPGAAAPTSIAPGTAPGTATGRGVSGGGLGAISHAWHRLHRTATSGASEPQVLHRLTARGSARYRASLSRCDNDRSAPSGPIPGEARVSAGSTVLA